jgi:hypothetical protein
MDFISTILLKESLMSRTKIRPQGYSDLDLIWAVRDIPSKILCIKLKSIIYTFIALIGNSESQWYYKSLPDLSEAIGISGRRLQDLLHKLEELGFIFINRPKKYLKGMSNEYQLNYQLILSTGGKFRAQSLGCQNVRHNSLVSDDSSVINRPSTGRIVRP